MISNKQISTARENWLKASKTLGFTIITPYSLFNKESEMSVFAFLPDYGSPNGTIVGLTIAPEFETDRDLIKLAETNYCFCSFVNVESCLTYDEDYFKGVLDDWNIRENNKPR